MKKIASLMLVLVLLTSGFSFAQQNKNTKPLKEEKKEKAAEAKPAPTGTPMKKDGTPDKRYKENKKLKKDGTPDKRYKENK